MVDVSRNDPCPCGSGRKYKKCCLENEREAPGSLRLPERARERAAEARSWEADIVPLGAAIDDDVAARPVVVLVTAAGFVVATEILTRVSGEPADVAERIADAVVAATNTVRARPAIVRVRHPEVATALEPLLASSEIAVERAALDELDVVAGDLTTSLTGHAPVRGSAGSETWAGWSLSVGTIGEIFRGAAALWRARPWVWLANEQALDVELPDGRSWTVSLLGQAGQEFGLVLYSAVEDFTRLLDASDVDAAFARPAGRIVSLSFANRGELPRRMQREVASRGWEVAAPDAYPTILTINTPAGGVSRQDASDLAAILAAVAALSSARGESLSRREALEWRDPATGIQLRHDPPQTEAMPRPALWAPLPKLRAGGPDGPGARPETAVLNAAAHAAEGLPDRSEVVRRFEAALRAEGLSEATVDRHTVNADTFLEFLTEWAEVPLAAVHEYDLRVFLFDWYPREALDAAHRQRAMPASLGRFFGWLADGEGLECPWAASVLDERRAYSEALVKSSGGAWFEPVLDEWHGALYRDLDARVMLHDDGLGRDETWGPGGPRGLSIGPVEARLDEELQRRWLLWRDDVIRAGETSPAVVRAQLVARQREWEVTPLPRLDGMTPLDVVERERGAAQGL